MKTRRPPGLRTGDRIGIVAPGGPVRQPALDRGIAWLRDRGLVPAPGRHLNSRHGYLAGTDAQRLEDLNAALAAPDLAAVWFARGGYGSARIVAQADLRPLRRLPKALIGYSDITVLHAAAWRTAGLVTYYGPLVGELGDREAFDDDSLWRAVGGNGASPLVFEFAPAQVARPGAAEGVLVGGCLSLVATLVGTAFAVPADGAILFWEEVNEEPYRIDRMLGQLRLAGCLDKVRGMVVGQLVGCDPKDPDAGLALREILDFHLGGRRIPVITDFPAGHCAGKVTLPLGVRARLDTALGRLTIPGD